MATFQLDYLYTPSTDVAADAAAIVSALDGRLGFAIDDGGTKVAMVELAAPPALLLTDHLPDGRTVHVFRVEDLDRAIAELEQQAWKVERRVELPPGPAVTLATPGGVRIALYEASRPFVVDSFRGRRDLRLSFCPIGQERAGVVDAARGASDP